MTALILHGWRLSGSLYKDLKTTLEKHGFTVFNPDLPGFGQASLPEKPLALADYVAYVTAFLAKKKVRTALVIGHSFGGRIALKLAAEQPALVRKLILTGVPGFLPVKKSKVFLFLLLAKAGKIIFALPGLRWAETVARKSLYRLAGASDYQHAAGVMRETFKKIISEDLSGYMAALKMPVTLIWGENDQVTPLWIGKKMAATIAGAKLMVVKNANHALPYQNGRQFARFCL